MAGILNVPGLWPVIDANGNPVSGATINFFQPGTVTPKPVYEDDTLATSLGTSLTTNAGGEPTTLGGAVARLWWAADNELFDVQVIAGGADRTWSDVPIVTGLGGVGSSENLAGLVSHWDIDGNYVTSNALRNMGLFDGLTFNTPNWVQMETSATHVGSSKGAFAVTHETTGSGGNGPTNSDVAVYIKTKKNIALTATDQGEIDGTYTYVDQRGQGDAACHLIHAENVYRDTAPVSAGLLAIECTARRRNNLGQYIQYGHAWLCHGEALVENYGQLLGIDMRLGTTKDGILIDTFYDTANAAPGALTPSYEWIFRYRQGRLDSSQIFGITGTGRMQWGPNTNKLSMFWSGSLFNITNNSDVGIWSINPTGDMFCIGSSNDGLGNVRLVPFQLANPTGSYTVVASDIGRLLFRTSGSVTINNGVFSVLGQMLFIRNESDSTMTVTRGTGTPFFRVNGANVTGDRTIAARSTICIMYDGTNQFNFMGPVT